MACFAVVDLAAPGIFESGGPNPLVVGLASWAFAAMVLVAVLVAATFNLAVSPRLSAVIRHQSTHLRRATTWAAGLNLLLLLSAVVDLAVDSADLPQVVLRCALVVTSVAGFLAMGRLGWFFSSIRRVATVGTTSP
jgi:hypothetical protein